MRRVVLEREETARGPLVLVNAAHPAAEISPSELTGLEGGVLMERRAARLLDGCVRAAGGWGNIVPVSGWRSREEQRSIWDETLRREGAVFTRRYVALPGCSEHETGLAIDLGERAERIDFIRPEFPDRGGCGAFRRLAAEYGFIQRYRREKEAVTGIAEEPWHFRWVGVPHARLMEENGLCLEEYGAFLRDGPKTCALPGGGKAVVSYLPCPRASVEVTLAEGVLLRISGHNDGGFILTQWEERT